MTRTITQRELCNNSGEIVRALDRGEDVIVTRNGIPVSELRPVRRRFVDRAGRREAFPTRLCRTSQSQEAPAWPSPLSP